MISIKITLNDEVRRVQVFTQEPEKFSYANLLETAKNLFPRLQSAAGAKFFWTDDENDLVTCSSDSEVAIAIKVMGGKEGKVCKFSVVLDDKKASVTSGSSNVVHDFVTCDGCGMSPLVGTRYKCSVRENFDLCEACESKDKQPFPMIKIYTKEQAPAGIFITINEPAAETGEKGPNPHCGPHHHHHGHHHHHSHHPHGHPGPHPHGPLPFGPPPFGPWEGGRRWGCGSRERKCGGRRGKKWENFTNEFMGLWRKPHSEGGLPDNLKNAAGPWVEAVAALTKVFEDGEAGSNGEGKTANGDAKPNTATDEAELESQLLDEVMRLSLQEQTASVESSAPAAATDLPEAKVVSEPPLLNESKYPPASYFSKFSPHASYTSPSTPKPMARFIHDVTLPDGSTVILGSKVTKTWRVRNDGELQWPEGVTLTFSSGDLLAGSPQELTIPVHALKANEEVDISVDLSIPETTGRHVTYFRLRTKEGNIFGQRLWADVRVIDVESDWVGVTTAQAFTVTAPPFVAVNAPVSALEQTREPVEAPMPEVSATVEGEQIDSAQDADSAPNPVDVWARVWAKELQILSDMGFNDTPSLITLLQKYVGLPVSLCADLKGVPHAEGMQKLVMELLGHSGSSSM